MITDPHLICAEMQAYALLAALQNAVDGAPHWRLEAARLLTSIANLELPEISIEALREVDARKRAAEQMADVVNGQCDVW